MPLGLNPISGGPIASTNTDVSLTNARVSQAVLEVLRTNTAVNARVSQVAMEVLRTNTAANARVSQIVIEVLRANGAETPIGGGAARPVVMVIT